MGGLIDGLMDDSRGDECTKASGNKKGVKSKGTAKRSRKIQMVAL